MFIWRGLIQAEQKDCSAVFKLFLKPSLKERPNIQFFLVFNLKNPLYLNLKAF